jgi:hypothetical protein
MPNTMHYVTMLAVSLYPNNYRSGFDGLIDGSGKKEACGVGNNVIVT